MSLAALRERIEAKTARLAVVGLGYVGLPVAAAFAEAGFRVTGVDVKPERVATINAGICPIEGHEPGLADLLAAVVAAGNLQATTDYRRLAEADVVLLDVETPVDEDHIPRYQALQAACQSLGPVLKPGALVIVESTTAPGTLDGVVRPLLAQSSGRQPGQEFFLGACPERVMPGRLLHNLRTLSRVCGGDSPETAQAMAALYRHVVQAELDLADPVTAEMVKTAENAYRDVQIAFANEVALICEAAGADVWRVRELVNKSPGRHMLLPGAGVGGHCIPKDPWLLVHGARGQVEARLMPAARAVNEAMPLHLAAMTVRGLESLGLAPAQARVTALGYAYLENSDDSRHSPTEPFATALRRLGAEVIIHDPLVAGYQAELWSCLEGSDAAAILVAHDPYRQIDLHALARRLRTPLLVDGRHLFTPAQAHAAGLVYRGVGIGGLA